MNAHYCTIGCAKKYVVTCGARMSVIGAITYYKVKSSSKRTFGQFTVS